MARGLGLALFSAASAHAQPEDSAGEPAAPGREVPEEYRDDAPEGRAPAPPPEAPEGSPARAEEGDAPRAGEKAPPPAASGEPRGAPGGSAPPSAASEQPSGGADGPSVTIEPAEGLESYEGAIEIEVNPNRTEAASDARSASADAESGGDPMEITVVGVRMRRVPGAVHVIRSADLERTEYDDPHAVLQSVPGVYVRGEDGVGLRPNIGLRGVSSDRTKKVTLMEDGVLLGPAPYSAPAAYYFPLVTRFTQVRVIKGPAAISYGPQTVGGAIDFMSRSIPSMDAGEIDVAAGQYAYGKVHAWAGTSTDKLGVVIEGAHIRSDGFKELPGGEDTGFYRNEVVFRGTYVPDPTARTPHEFGLKLSYSDELSNETYLGLTDDDFRDDPLQRYGPSKLDQMRWHRTGIVLSHRTRPIDELEVVTQVYRHDFSRRWNKANRFGGAGLFDVATNPEDPVNATLGSVLRGEQDLQSSDATLYIGPNQRDFVSQGVQSRFEWETATGPVGHRVEYGLRLHYDRIERLHEEDGYQIVGGDVIPTGEPTVTTQSNEAWTEAVAFHARDAISWDRLTLTPGVRVELLRSAFIDRQNPGGSGRGSTEVVLPGGGAFVSITDSFGVLAGAYRGFSPPPPGRPEATDPELSVNYEAGARYSEGRARAEVIGFFNDYSNLTDVCTLSGSGCPDANLGQQFDAGSAHIYGAEAFVAHEIPVTSELRTPLRGAYTLTLSEFRSDFDSEDPIFGAVQAGDEVPYIPRHLGNVLVGLESDRGGGYAVVNYVSSMREQAGSELLSEALSTDELVTLDVGGSYRPIEWLKVYANVRNVLDSQFIVSHRPYGARPNAPRWVQVGAKASF